MLPLISGYRNNEEQLTRNSNKIHFSVLSVDMHCDTPMDFVFSDSDLGVEHDDICVGFSRMKEGDSLKMEKINKNFPRRGRRLPVCI